MESRNSPRSAAVRAIGPAQAALAPVGLYTTHTHTYCVHLHCTTHSHTSKQTNKIKDNAMHYKHRNTHDLQSAISTRVRCQLTPFYKVADYRAHVNGVVATKWNADQRTNAWLCGQLSAGGCRPCRVWGAAPSAANHFTLSSTLLISNLSCQVSSLLPPPSSPFLPPPSSPPALRCSRLAWSSHQRRSAERQTASPPLGITKGTVLATKTEETKRKGSGNTSEGSGNTMERQWKDNRNAVETHRKGSETQWNGNGTAMERHNKSSDKAKERQCLTTGLLAYSARRRSDSVDLAHRSHRGAFVLVQHMQMHARTHGHAHSQTRSHADPHTRTRILCHSGKRTMAHCVGPTRTLGHTPHTETPPHDVCLTPSRRDHTTAPAHCSSTARKRTNASDYTAGTE